MLKDNPKMKVIAIVCIFIAIITFSYLFLIQWQAPKSAADGVTAATRGDYEKAVKIWYALAKQGDGPSKQNLYDILRGAVKEIIDEDYKQAAEILRPYVTIGYPIPIYTDPKYRPIGLTLKINRWKEAKAAAKAAKAAAKGKSELDRFVFSIPIPSDERPITAEFLLELTEFLIQKDNKTFTP